MRPLARFLGSNTTRAWRVLPLAALATLLAIAACSGDDGEQGPPGPPGPPGDGGTDDEIALGEDPPELQVTIEGLTGGTGPGGNFLSGNRMTIRFRVTKEDGSDWDITEFSSGRALVSGPTFNYQRVIAQVSDVQTTAVANSDGSYSYTFPTAIPATYLAPLNDTTGFDETDGELTGQALVDGTYTLGLYFQWPFTVDGEEEKTAGNVLHDFLIGAAGTITPREVVLQENCNRCHDDLQAHGGSRHGVTLCLLCHTAGAEDSSGGVVSVDFKVMIHKIHAGKHLPSVLGVATNPDGTRNYAATPVPYVVGGTDYSHIAFPAWPQGQVPMPRDEGYSALTSEQKALEDEMRKGPSNCVVCHGDPDGIDGPLGEPAQGDLIYSQPRRATCGACHDDVHWGANYAANGLTMLSSVTLDDTLCLNCHPATGAYTPGVDVPPNDAAHLHPLLDPAFDEGVVLSVASVVEAGTNDGDGTVDAGEKIALTFSIETDAGTPIDPVDVASPSIVIAGPTGNYNVLLNTSIPAAALTGGQPFTVNAPMLVQLELAGISTGALDAFTTDFTPHWNVAGALTTVRARVALGATTTLAEAADAPQNYVDVASSAGFARDDYVVLDVGLAGEEYLRIQYVDGNRLWFGALGTTSYAPGLAHAHAAASSVRLATLSALTEGVHYSLNASTGTITELVELGVGRVILATYTTDFVMPATYPLTLNDSPDLGETVGEWSGKPIVAGTYSASLWTSKSLTLSVLGESNSYKSASEANLVDFLVGDALSLEPYELIAGGFSCNNCHQDLAFHGFGRRDFDSCVVCHGAAGTEDRPPYVAANAPATEARTINFRTMIHAVHMGKDLTHADDYELVGFGSGAYPDNFSTHTYEEVAFPVVPGGVQKCTHCHGAENTAWQDPSDRNHPTDQGDPVTRWTVVCAACHDSDDARGHIKSQTGSTGFEGCGVCHGPGETWSVEKMHKTY